MNLNDLFHSSLAGRRDSCALEWRHSSSKLETWTFGELDIRSNRLAHLLRQRGLCQGDRLAVYLANRVELIDLYLACIKAGILFVPINVLYREREVAHLIRDAEPKAVVAAGDFPHVFQAWHCEDLGRDYNSIIKSAEVFTHLVLPGQTAEQATAKVRRDVSRLVGHEVSLEEFRQGNFRGYPQGIIGSPQEAIGMFNSLIEAGVEYIIVYLSNVVHLDTLRAFAEEVLPAFRA